MILGSPGGGKIITTVFQTIINVLDFNFSLNAAIDQPRNHHQWLPDYIQYEKGFFNDEMLSYMKGMQYDLKEVPDFGRIDAILIDWDTHTFYGHSDKRGHGLAMGF